MMRAEPIRRITAAAVVTLLAALAPLSAHAAERCLAISQTPGQPRVATDLPPEFLASLAADQPLVVPPDVPRPLDGFACIRDTLMPGPNDYKVLFNSYHMVIMNGERSGVLHIDKGKIKLSTRKGTLTPQEEVQVEQAVARVQADYDQAVAASDLDSCSALFTDDGKTIKEKVLPPFSMLDIVPDAPFVLPPDAPRSTTTLVCERKALRLGPNDYKVKVAGYRFGILSNGRTGMLENVDGRLKFNMIEGKISEAEAEQIRQDLAVMEAAYRKAEPGR